MKKDNQTLGPKAALRLNLLALVPSPVVLETHGGMGSIYRRCYSHLERGAVIEKSPVKAQHLARQRPTWAVYEGDCISALAAGVGQHLPVNFVDIDPYGEAWHVVDAFFEGQRHKPDTLGIAVNDGLRNKLKMQTGWNVGSLAAMVSKYGNAALYENYLSICRELLQEKAQKAGYDLLRWAGYYCGTMQNMTHYAGLFVRT